MNFLLASKNKKYDIDKHNHIQFLILCNFLVLSDTKLWFNVLSKYNLF